jgi:hypothetical protein
MPAKRLLMPGDLDSVVEIVVVDVTAESWGGMVSIASGRLFCP